MTDQNILEAIYGAVHVARDKHEGLRPDALVLHPDDWKQLCLVAEPMFVAVSHSYRPNSVMGLPVVESSVQRHGYVGVVFDEPIRPRVKPPLGTRLEWETDHE